MDGISELAKMFKERENKLYLGPQIGKVKTPPPNITIDLGNGIILDKDDLIIAAHVLKDYEREAQVTSTAVTGSTNTVSQHSHSINSLQLTGKVKFTDTLKKGDEVILIPSTDAQTYILIDKAVRL